MACTDRRDAQTCVCLREPDKTYPLCLWHPTAGGSGGGDVGVDVGGGGGDVGVGVDVGGGGGGGCVDRRSISCNATSEEACEASKGAFPCAWTKV